jgi:alpha-glucosidase (family GH31 glycosyl hydrolase)
MPIMRALWLHYPDDAVAVARGDEYLWGRDLLIAPVVEKGGTTRRVYLPKGDWYDFWTNERVAGGREVERGVDLVTLPIYVRAGAIIPMGPVKQYTEERVDAPTELVVYPGVNGTASWYDDDGHSFDYRKGAFMRLAMQWSDRDRRLSLRLAAGSKMIDGSRKLSVRVAGAAAGKELLFTGKPAAVVL